MSKPQVSITADNIGEFIQKYEQAKAAGEEQFDFHGAPVLVDYAGYVIKYFNMQKTEE